MKVKDLLKHDLPPTDADAKLRREHTVGSVKHNLKHLFDHGDGLMEALKKLHTVDSKKAKEEAEKAKKKINHTHNKVKDWIKR